MYQKKLFSEKQTEDIKKKKGAHNFIILIIKAGHGME